MEKSRLHILPLRIVLLLVVLLALSNAYFVPLAQAQMLACTETPIFVMAQHAAIRSQEQFEVRVRAWNAESGVALPETASFSANLFNGRGEIPLPLISRERLTYGFEDLTLILVIDRTETMPWDRIQGELE